MLRMERLNRTAKVNTLTLINTGLETQSECEVNVIHFAAIMTAGSQYWQALAVHDDRNVGAVVQYRQASAEHGGRLVGSGKRNVIGTDSPRPRAGCCGKGDASGCATLAKTSALRISALAHRNLRKPDIQAATSSMESTSERT